MSTNDAPEAGEGAEHENELVDDATIAVTPDDATIVVSKPDSAAKLDDVVEEATVAADETVAVSQPATGDDAFSDQTVAAASPTTETGTGGGPVVDGVEIPASLAKLLFKRPLDPKRRAPESPFPKGQSSLPRGGVRPDIPVVYGARAEELEHQSDGTDFARWIGPPPKGEAPEPTNRDSLPSTVRANLQYARIAFFGGAGVVVIAIFGLWWIATELF